MAAHAGDSDDVPIPLEAGVHGPQHVVGIENVHVLIHQDHVLQLRESGESQQRRLPLFPLVGVDGFAALEHRHILAAARAVGVAVDHLAGEGFVDHAQDAGLGGDARHIHVLLAGADAGLHDGVLAVGDGLHLQQPALMGGRAVVAGELGHGVPRVGVLIFYHVITPRQNLALDDIFRVGDSVFVDSYALHQLHRPLPQRPGNGKLVEAQGRGGGLKTGEHLNGRVYPNGNRDGQGLAQLCSPLGHGPDVAGTGLADPDGNPVQLKGVSTHPMDGHVGQPGVRVGGVAHPQGDIWSRVHRGVGGGWNQLEQVEVRLLRPVYHLLAGGGVVHHHGLDRVSSAGLHQVAQLLFFAAKQVSHPLPAGQHTDGHRRAGVTLHVVEHHGGAVHGGGAHDGAARAHLAVHPGQLRRRVNLHVRLNQLAGGVP